MIEQQINLYQDRFRHKHILLSAAQLLILIVLLAFGMAGYSGYLERELGKAQATNIVLKQQRQSIADELSQVNAELNKLLSDTRMDDQITETSREIRARKKVLDFVDNNQFGSGRGFSDYLTSLSNLQVENVWLDEIKFAENYVRIHGSSLSAELIPIYFDRFSEESVFKGNRFDVFRLDRDKETEWKVDFEIATHEALNDQ